MVDKMSSLMYNVVEMWQRGYSEANISHWFGISESRVSLLLKKADSIFAKEEKK